jgi:hypothetical protein
MFLEVCIGWRLLGQVKGLCRAILTAVDPGQPSMCLSRQSLRIFRTEAGVTHVSRESPAATAEKLKDRAGWRSVPL